jgi:hypothetical protein
MQAVVRPQKKGKVTARNYGADMQTIGNYKFTTKHANGGAPLYRTGK